MTVIAHWVLEGREGAGTVLNVAGSEPIPFGQQVRVVKWEDYDALAEQLRGAVDLLREATEGQGVCSIAGGICQVHGWEAPCWFARVRQHLGGQ